MSIQSSLGYWPIAVRFQTLSRLLPVSTHLVVGVVAEMVVVKIGGIPVEKAAKEASQTDMTLQDSGVPCPPWPMNLLTSQRLASQR